MQDIPQGASVRAVLTLGKDLTFRDYAQGAYRMRGIGQGQTVILFVIPEIQRMITHETAIGHGMTSEARSKQLTGMSPETRSRAQLEDVAAWLLLNSIRAEKLQFPLWCMQCAQNVWRKQAFKQLTARHVEITPKAGARSMATRPSSSIESDEVSVRECLDVFREHVSRDVSSTVPSQTDTRREIVHGADKHAALLQDVNDVRTIEKIQAMLIGVEGPAHTIGPSQGNSPTEPDPACEQEQCFEQQKEQEQEHEHEHEQEKQREVEKETDHIDDEPEEFIRERYVRDTEPARTWSLSSLSLPPEFAHSGAAVGTSDGCTGTAQGFFPASRFASHKTHVEKRGPLHWPDYALLSSDHTSPRWRYDSHHRLKNIIVTMEWVPDTSACSALTASAVDSLPAASGMELSDGQDRRLRRLFELCDPRGNGTVGEQELRTVLSDLGMESDGDDHAAVNELIDSLRTGSDGSILLDEPAFLQLMRSQRFVPGQSGRYWVALSLREAESIRGAIHLAMDMGVPLVSPKERVAIGLRVFGALLDATGALVQDGDGFHLTDGAPVSDAFPMPPRLQLQSAMQAFRFIDSQLGFTDSDARLLLRMLRTDTCDDRTRWFNDTRACRRRPQGKLELMQSTAGIMTILKTEDEFHLLVQAATMRLIGAVLARRRFGTHDVFHAFNSARNGLLSCGELGAGLAWLDLDVDEGQLHDLCCGMDYDGNGRITLDAWCEALPAWLPEVEPSTQTVLATVQLAPLHVSEVGQSSQHSVEAIPPSALSKFRFKLVPQKTLCLIWSTRNTNTRHDLSFWSPELDSAPLHKRHRVRLCVGHTCTNGLDPPGKGGRVAPLVLEVSDSAVTLGSSEYLQAVVEQLFPLPLRFRLAWFSLQHKPPLYIWRAVPPSGQFVALGMVATTNEEPPPLNALCCVPRRWCEKHPVPPRLVWRDDGGGGRPGSFWVNPATELVLAVQGSEPPEETWHLREDKISTDNWLVSTSW